MSSTSGIITDNPYVLLVVDDEEGPRKSLEMTFRRDFKVVLARSGEEALVVAEKTPPDVAILDLRMPGISGIEVLEQLKRRDPCVEVVILTAFETAETTKAALRLGAVDYLSKPFDLTLLREAVRRALEIRLAGLEGQRMAQREKIDGVKADEAHVAEAHRLATELYAGIIHDINNPMTTIVGHLDLALGKVERAATSHDLNLREMRQHLNLALSAATHASKIAGRYLQTARAINTSGMFSELAAFVKDFHAMIGSHPSAKRRTLQIDGTVPSLKFMGDTVLLMQVLSNLVVNAFHASPVHGAVAIRATRVQNLAVPGTGQGRQVVGNIKAGAFPEALVFEVIDQGQGMGPEILEKIFTPFFTTKGVHGTGMGLPMVVRITEHLQGWVSIESAQGKGTTATIAFPLSGPEASGTYRIGLG